MIIFQINLKYKLGSTVLLDRLNGGLMILIIEQEMVINLSSQDIIDDFKKSIQDRMVLLSIIFFYCIYFVVIFIDMNILVHLYKSYVLLKVLLNFYFAIKFEF